MNRLFLLPRSGFLLLVCVTLASGIVPFQEARADLVYVADTGGSVGVWDTESSTGSFLGDLRDFDHGQFLGLAYRASTGDVLVLDRGIGNVFSMDATTGDTELLFASVAGFQGGAVKGELLYGSLENTQQVEAYAIPAGVPQGLNGDTFVHTHAMGIDPATGQLYLWTDADDSIRRVNDDGTDGGTVLISPGAFVDDLDFFQGDFLATEAADNIIVLIDADTGSRSLYLSTDELDSMGLDTAELISGVVVVGESSSPPVPSVSEWGLIVVVLLLLTTSTAILWRRRSTA